MRSLLVIAGPTASGKTALAHALAAQGPLRLISADSQLVYRGMDIGTAKPPAAERAAWGLIDLVDPGQSFSAGEFCRQAKPLVEAAWGQGQTPVLVGGTGLYLKALLEGLADIPAVPDEIRERLEDEHRRLGLEPLLARLDAVDPAGAAALDRKNPRRVLRALEVFEATGRALSAWQRDTHPAVSPDRALWLGLDPGAEALEERIRARVQSSLAEGWLQETLCLQEKWGAEAVGKSAAIGYPELSAVLKGTRTLEQASQDILIQTRQYARRQRTWFRAQADIHWSASPVQALADPALATFLS